MPAQSPSSLTEAADTSGRSLQRCVNGAIIGPDRPAKHAAVRQQVKRVIAARLGLDKGWTTTVIRAALSDLDLVPHKKTASADGSDTVRRAQRQLHIARLLRATQR